MRKDFVITNEKGLHARPATHLVSVASKFECSVTIIYNGIKADFKSIMNVLGLGLKQGSLITIVTDGVDELEALEKISDNINKFNLG